MTTTVLAYIPSPSQGVWHLGPFPLRAYALFIVAGMVAALLIGDKRWQQRGGEPGVIYGIFWWAMPFGLIGGRLYHVLTDWQTYFGDDGAGFFAAFRIWEGGLGIWGAVALGGVGAWIGCRQYGIPLPAFGDAVAPGIVLAQAIGRLGNYFNQELYGRPTTLPWGLELYERRDASGYSDSLNGVSTGQPLIPGVEAVHPTFLYELLWNLLVFAALIYIDRRFKIGHGRLFAMYVAGYCIGRFWIELMRSDLATHIAGIRINSFTSTFVFIGAVVYIMVAPKGREDPATLKGNALDVERDDKEDTAVEEFAKELTGVAAATTGVVAAAKVAGEFEDEDAKAAADEVEEARAEPADALAEEAETEPEVEESDEAVAEEAEPEADEAQPVELEPEPGADEEPESAEAQESEPEAEAEEAEPEAEAAVDAVEVAKEADEPADEEPETEAEEERTPTEAAEEPESEAEAEEAEPEAAVDAAEEVAAAVADEPADEEPETEAEEEPAPTEAAEEPEPEADEAAEAEEEAEAAEPSDVEYVVEDIEAEPTEAAAEEPDAEAAAEIEAAQAAEEDTEQAEASDDQEAEADEAVEEAEAAETADAEAAVAEVEAEPSAEVAASVVEEAEASEDQDTEAEILGEETEPTEDVAASEEPDESPSQAQEPGGRIRRWLRGRRG